MAAAYTLSYGVGLVITARLLRRRLGGYLDGCRLIRTYGKLIVASALAGTLGWAAARAGAGASLTGTAGTSLDLAVGALTMVAGYLVLARLLRTGELSLLRR
ncbi:hypothetical protein [Streptomyces luteocolor]|uniref:hypothetical protein n=1 Tax=Streptomyces luteocolor TaxID=285500 RepID=UPI0008534190